MFFRTVFLIKQKSFKYPEKPETLSGWPSHTHLLDNTHLNSRRNSGKKDLSRVKQVNTVSSIGEWLSLFKFKSTVYIVRYTK